MRFLFILCLALGLAMSAAPVFASGHGEKKTEEGDVAQGDETYLRLQPLVVPVVDDDGVEQIITMIIELHVADEKTSDRLRANMPRLRDAIMRAIYGGFSDKSLMNRRMVDISKMKVRLRDILNDTFGADSVRNVLVQGLAQRML